MADSDEEYVAELSDADLNMRENDDDDDDDDLDIRPASGARASRSRAKRRKQRGGAEWEVSRTWETLVEGADGTISSTVEGLLEAGKRQRYYFFFFFFHWTYMRKRLSIDRG